MQLETVNCPLCDSDRSRPWIRGKDRLWQVPGEYQFVRCRQCGHRYLNPRPDYESIDLCYTNSYPDHYRDAPDETAPESDGEEPAVPAESAAETEQRPWYLSPLFYRIPGLRGLFRWLTHDAAMFVPDPDPAPEATNRALDVGCADGLFLIQLRKAGWTASGVELVEAPAQRARDRGFEVTTGTLESAQLPASSFDMVCLWGVVTLVHDPVATLTEVHRILKPGGRVVISCPNAACWEPVVFRGFWYAFMVPTNLHHYSPRTIRQVLERVGFQREKTVFHRNLLNVIGSLGLLMQAAFPKSSLAAWLAGYPARPRLWVQLLTGFPAQLLGRVGQTGRMTVVARSVESDGAETRAGSV